MKKFIAGVSKTYRRIIEQVWRIKNFRSENTEILQKKSQYESTTVHCKIFICIEHICGESIEYF